MLIISVDFVQLEVAVYRLAALYNSIEDELNSVRDAYNKICGMGLDNMEEELLHNIHELELELDSIQTSSRKLNHIMNVYRECEDANSAVVDNLPFNMPIYKHTKLKSDAFGFQEAVNIRAFKANSVRNEFWLENIIDERQ